MENVPLSHDFVIYFKCVAFFTFRRAELLLIQGTPLCALCSCWGWQQTWSVKVKLNSRNGSFARRKMVSKRLKLTTLTLNNLSESITRKCSHSNRTLNKSENNGFLDICTSSWTYEGRMTERISIHRRLYIKGKCVITMASFVGCSSYVSLHCHTRISWIVRDDEL